MKKFIYLIILGFAFTLYPSWAVAQESSDTTLYQVEMTGGNEFLGYILKQDSETILLKTENLGTLTIPRSSITKITEIKKTQIVQGSLWNENPQASRYFWSPNGYGLNAGEGYYQNVWVLFNQISIGITDNISIGGGFIPLFLFAGGPTPVWLTPKFSVPLVKDKLNLGGGALMGTVVSEEGASFGIVYGTLTTGSKDKNFSAGLGYGYADHEWTNAPVINLSAMIRTGRRGYFLTENYFFSTSGETVVLLMAGGRYLVKKASIDYGLMIPIAKDMDGFVAVPWLGIVFPF
nr:hypothetical protein [Bacteroidota bacterium]